MSFSYLIKASDIKVTYGDRIIFEIEGLEIRSSSKIGLVGRNGAGKSTLLHVLSGLREPDEGRVDVRALVAHISQEPDAESLRRKNPWPVSRQLLAAPPLSECPSGGELTRTVIRNALDSGTDVLMADEPTTNLDADGIEKLEGELLSFRGGLVLISHDRALLDSVCNEIWELEEGSLRVYPGNYSAWCKEREREKTFEREEYERSMREKERLEAAARRAAERARASAKKPRGMSSSEARLISNKNKSARAQQTLNASAHLLLRRAKSAEPAKRPQDLPEIRMSIGNACRLDSPFALRVLGLDVAFGGRVLLDGVSFDILSGKKSVLIGPNGSGKTTLLRLIEREGGEKGIRKSPQLAAGFFSQAHEGIDPGKTVLENARAFSDLPEHEVRTILARLGIAGGGVFKRCSVLSGGERAKVAFARLLASRLNMIVLDEPTNHIDIYTAEALEELLAAWSGTLLLATHDRRLISRVADRLLIIEGKTVRTFEGTWDEYETRANKSGRDNRNADANMAKNILDMRMAELSTRISLENDPKVRAGLDAEWRACMDELKVLRGGLGK